jgi:phenylacetate-CoA ligase
LKHAFSSVPYLQQKYRAAGVRFEDLRGWDDFRHLPPLTREEINAHQKELCSTAYKGKLLPHATGGSTGTPTRFFRTYESYDWRTAAKDRVYGWSGWRLGEPSSYLWGAPVGAVSRRQIWKTHAYERIHRQLIFNTFSQTEELWHRIYAEIVKYRPVLVVGYVSSLEQFADFLQNAKLSIPGIRCVIAAGRAALCRVTNRDSSERFRRRSTTRTAPASSCRSPASARKRQGLHVNVENLVVETRDPEPDRTSEILVTDLHNYGMPFIRYASGDSGRLSNARCRCGRELPLLDSIEGRVLDLLRTADGRTVPANSSRICSRRFLSSPNTGSNSAASTGIVISAVLTQPLSERSESLLAARNREGIWILRRRGRYSRR